MRFWTALIGAGWLAAACGVGRGQPADALPAGDELHQLFDQGQYQPLLQKLARVLALKGNAARPYDRVEMQLLRAETLLQLKQQSAASAAVAAALKEVDDKTDPALAARAKATELLVKRSKALTFTPRTATRGQVPPPVSLLDAGRRPAAFEALRADLKDEMGAKLRAAKTARSLVPIKEAIDALADFRAVELTATGREAESQTLLDGLAGRAGDLMNEGLKDLKKRQLTLAAAANELVANVPTQGQAVSETTYHKRGIEYRIGEDLKEVAAAGEKIAEAAAGFAEAAKSSPAGPFDAIRQLAEKTAKEARDTLAADYTGVFGGRKR